MSTNDLENKIIAAAKEIFTSKGYENTNMSDIAAKVGINRPSLHYYYRTKELMFRAVAGSIVGEIIPRINLLVSDSGLSFFDKIERFLDCYMSVYERNPDLLYFIVNESRRDFDLLLKFVDSAQFTEYTEGIMRMVNEEMDAGRIKRVPLHFLVSQVISQLAFPFIARPLVDKAFCGTPESFSEFLRGWKSYIIDELKATLAVK